jgi:hypothetical protein
MLIEFKISNFRSIAEQQVLNMSPTLKYKDYLSNILTVGKNQALNAVAIYGANASGKSNMLRAFAVLDKLVHTSAKNNSLATLDYTPFLLKEGYEQQPTTFEITFILDDTRYRYGLAYNKTTIISEYLYRKVVSRETVLFLREADTIDASSPFSSSAKLVDIAIEATRENALFLSICDMLNIPIAKKILAWFQKLISMDGLNTEDAEAFKTLKLFQNPTYQEPIKKYLMALDLGFFDVSVEQLDFNPNTLPPDLNEEQRNQLITLLSGKKQLIPQAYHYVYNDKNEKTTNVRAWSLNEYESRGTQKAFEWSGPISYILLKGGVLIIDEIEAKMHPILTLNTIKLFLNKDTNPHNAQIIFATHDTNLLSYAELRRDQIFFVEKNNTEATELYALSDFKYFNQQGEKEAERIDSDKEKRYLEGRYGAIPMLGNFIEKQNLNYGETRQIKQENNKPNR